jgi:uncharacterized protein (TIGR03437 family)
MQRFFAAALFLIAVQAGHAQSYIFFTFDPPGSILTLISGINNSGQIVGRYQDSSGLHSFLRTGAIYPNIEAPGANPGETAANGVNNLGQVVGSYTAGSASHGFLLAADGKTFVTFEVPGETTLRAINDNGDIIGIASAVEGFLRRANGSVSLFRVPNSSATRPSAINNKGEIVGTYVTGGAGGIARGFMRNIDGSYVSIDVPGIEGTQVTGLNNAGQITGNFGGHGFVRNMDGTYVTFDVLGARETYPAGINDSGQIAGYYYSDQGGYHGFLALPAQADQRPAIRSVRGVMSASGFGGLDTIASGSWIEIYGQNLAPVTREWQSSDFSGDSAPMSLEGVSVRINGRPAYVSYISPGQINAQTPSGLAPGAAPVVVSTGGATSNAFSVQVMALRPGLLEIRPVTTAVRYVAALASDNATFVLPPSTYSLPARRATAGDTITLYGIGFGPVTPEIPAGQIAGQLNSLQSTFQIFFNGVAGSVTYAGLAPGTVGLYQFNVVIPVGIPAAGDQVMVTFQLNGVPGTQKLYTAIE